MSMIRGVCYSSPQCNQVCGAGSQIRKVRCPPMASCDPETKPYSSQDCNEMPCEGVEWITSDWEGVSSTGQCYIQIKITIICLPGYA